MIFRSVERDKDISREKFKLSNSHRIRNATHRTAPRDGTGDIDAESGRRFSVCFFFCVFRRSRAKPISIRGVHPSIQQRLRLFLQNSRETN